MQTPKDATAKSKVFPCFCCNGNKVSKIIMQIEPISDAAFKKPKPSGPTFKISLAKTGTIATAPPKRTANRSKDNAPNNSLVLNTNLNPSITLSHVFISPGLFKEGFCFNLNISNAVDMLV